MDVFANNSHWFALLGIVIVIISLMARLRQRAMQNAQRQNQRKAQIESAREAERKRQKQSAAMPKSSVGKTVSPDRMPMPDPFGTPFTGGIPAQFARWEAEIYKLGRQITGQIDSKMAALQVLTQDANRTANRLEVLVEHLEELARQQIERQQTERPQTVSSRTDSRINTNSNTGTRKDSRMDSVTGSVTGSSAGIDRSIGSSIGSTEQAGRFLPADIAEPQVAEATPLAAVLKELNADLDKIHKSISDNPLPPEMAAPVKLFRPAVPPPEERPAGQQPQLPVRKEVEMLADYGYGTDEIARQLNISAGEVDLILQLQGK